MIKKRKFLFSIIGLCLFLTACGTSANHSNKSTTKATVHNTKKQENTASQTKKTDSNYSQKNHAQNSKSMNLEQIKGGNFTSLVGNWKNNDNKTIKITGTTVNAPADTSFYKKVGTQVEGLPEINGQPTVITSGKIANGYIQGSIGHFVSNGDSLEPLTIIPKGVKASPDDDSDNNQDRLIKGGGQSGYANSAYYRQNN
ncbi:DUF6287 domain-containing protein [Fructilactobacillus vespulae]|uniref:DUF6287 domain-containing protein n=1 Tax=Fructilactobacillus vespulae TaxID=1249630 RepID=UPI0039B45A0B